MSAQKLVFNQLMKQPLGDPIIRLVGGPVEYMGRVEVYDRKSNQWGTICYDDIDASSYRYIIASLVCHYIFGDYYHAYGPANLSYNIQPSTNNPIVNGPIDCGTSSRDYDHFYQCPSFPLNATEAMSRCTPDQEWVVVCSCKLQYTYLYYTVYICIYWLLTTTNT